MADTQLRILIDSVFNGRGTDEAISGATKLSLENAMLAEKSRVAAKAQRDLANAVLSGELSFEEAEQQLEALNRELGDFKDPANDASLKWTELASKISVAQQAYGMVSGVAETAYDSIKRGAEITLARDRFDALANSIDTTAEALTGKLSEATGGMMSNAEMVASASQIISLELADTGDGVVDLASLISELGWDMQQVIMTFANNSKARLDSLGLSVTDVEDKMKTLEGQGYDADKAFDMAVIEAGKEKLDLLGSAAGTTVGDIKRFEAASADLRANLDLLVTKGLSPVVRELAYLTGQLADVSEKSETAGSKMTFLRYLRVIAEYTTQSANPALLDYIDNLEKVNERIDMNAFAMRNWQHSAGLTTEEIEAMNQTHNQTVEGTYDYVAAADAANERLEFQAALARDSEDAASRLEESLGQVAGANYDAAEAIEVHDARAIGLLERVRALDTSVTATVNLEAFGLDKLERAKRLMDSLRGFNANDQPDPYDPEGDLYYGDEYVVNPDELDDQFAGGGI